MLICLRASSFPETAADGLATSEGHLLSSKNYKSQKHEMNNSKKRLKETNGFYVSLLL